MMLFEKEPVETLKVLFSKIEDPRSGENSRHSIAEILFLAITGNICGSESWRGIEIFGKERLAWLRQFFAYEKGSPSRHTVSRIFSLVKPVYFEAMLSEVARFFCESNSKISQHIAIDGKTVRGTGNYKDTALHLLNAMSVNNGITLSQVECKENSNEITAIPHILETLQLEGATVTIDAAGCQTAVAKKIRRLGADYVLAVKGNQGGLLRQIEEYFEGTGFTHDKPEYFYETIEKGHGRIERRCYQVAHPQRADIFKRWQGLRSIIMVVSEVTRGNNTPSSQVRYFISSLDPNPKEAAKLIRGHWGIENCLHWTLDVVFKEDADQKRKDHAPRNFSALRKFVLNIVRKYLGKMTGVKDARTRAGYNPNYLEALLKAVFA